LNLLKREKSALSGVESSGPKAAPYVHAIDRIFLFFLFEFVRFCEPGGKYRKKSDE
jgi:hypothetical protein